MKEVFSNYGLAVSIHKNANISGTIQDTKMEKIEVLFSHKKFRMKLKSSLKKWVNLREVQNDGGFLQYKLSDRDMVYKTLPGI